MGLHCWMAQRLVRAIKNTAILVPTWMNRRMIEVDKAMRSWNSVNNWKERV